MLVKLSQYDNSWYQPGRNRLIRGVWYVINSFFLQNSLNPSSKLKSILIRLFGAKVGRGVVLKPSINVKYPWHLEIGDFTWIGEGVWIDSLGKITIGSNCCISQGAYLCTGNHDWADPAFGLIVKPIIVEDGSWIGAGATILPGVTIKTHSIVTVGSVVSRDTEPYVIYSGNPATPVKNRMIENSEKEGP